jgi:hypothetical protein
MKNYAEVYRSMIKIYLLKKEPPGNCGKEHDI